MKGILAAWVCLGLLAPAQAGTIEGTVTIRSPLKARPTGDRKRFTLPPGVDVYRSQPRKAATPVDQVLNVVVFLADAKGGPESVGTATITQRNREFIPFVLPIRVGTRVEFPNQDTVYHSVYSDSEARPFELKEYPRGESRTVTFDRPGVVKLFCAIHPHMNAYVLVLQNGFFTSPGSDHSYRIPNVPAGTYRLEAWHPQLNSVSRSVEVPAEGCVSANLTL
ncbi:MAG: hypothetical protein AB1758_09765 [Candidatus Eremiobacterota bacterium]